MRICPICRLGLRMNDPSGGLVVTEELGTLLGLRTGEYGGVCSECCSKYQAGHHCAVISINDNPLPVVEGNGVPRTYPRQLSDSPSGLDQAPAWFCGVCQQFARDGDTMEAMRLYPEDAPDALHLFPTAVCSHFDEGHCIACSWTGPYEERCPQCWQRERLAGLEHHRPREYSRRICDWAGPCQDLCPICGSMTRRLPECYYACGECRASYWPTIVRRLKREKLVPADFPEMTAPIAHMLA
jgi:hypothetical protein